MIRKKCPLCGNTSRAFHASSSLRSSPDEMAHERARNLKIPGDGPRRNVQCPKCGSLDYERLLYLYLLHETELFIPTAPEMRVLYIRPTPRLAHAIERVWRVRLDTCTEQDLLEFEENTARYDIVLCNHVFERMRDESTALRRVHGIAKREARIIVQSAVSPALPATFEDEELDSERRRVRAFGNRERVRLYGQDFPERLSSAGFSVREFRRSTTDTRYGGLVNRYALPAGQVLFALRRREQIS